jgi:peroxiredoxin
MKNAILLSAFVTLLFATPIFAETPEGSMKKLDWKFSEADLRLFAPPMDATIEEMRAWADRLERPFPDNLLEKWGSLENYRERVALLKIDISKQIIASKPDDITLSLAWHMQWFPHYLLAQQESANIPKFENLYAELKQQNEAHGLKPDGFTNTLMSTRKAVVRDLLKLKFDEKYLALGEELIAEYDAILEKNPQPDARGLLGTGAFYQSKADLLRELVKHDKKYVSTFENSYTNLKRQNESHGWKLDEITCTLMWVRGLVVKDITELDKKYFALGEELLAEYDMLLEGKPLGKNAEVFYFHKSMLLFYLSQRDKKFEAAHNAFSQELRELVKARESELETAILYEYLGPAARFDTPEGQAAQRAWVEEVTRRIAATDDEKKQCALHRIKVLNLMLLLESNATTVEEYLAQIKEMETQRDKYDKDSPLYFQYAVSISNSLNFSGLFFAYEPSKLLKLDTIADENLEHLFALTKIVLKSGRGARGFNSLTLNSNGDKIFARLTPAQQMFYLGALTELLWDIEENEKEKWVAAGKPANWGTETASLQRHFDRLQLPNTQIAFVATTLDGKPFDLDSLRGKVVLLDCWSTTCRPCLEKMPEMKEHYEKYHARGFEIVGILCDSEENKGRAVEIIETQQLPWIQLHDPYWKLHKQLNGYGVPYCLLLDREGKVVLQNARGERLKKKLEELLPEK